MLQFTWAVNFNAFTCATAIMYNMLPDYIIFIFKNEHFMPKQDSYKQLIWIPSEICVIFGK